MFPAERAFMVARVRLLDAEMVDCAPSRNTSSHPLPTWKFSALYQSSTSRGIRETNTPISRGHTVPIQPQQFPSHHLIESKRSGRESIRTNTAYRHFIPNDTLGLVKPVRDAA